MKQDRREGSLPMANDTFKLDPLSRHGLRAVLQEREQIAQALGRSNMEVNEAIASLKARYAPGVDPSTVEVELVNIDEGIVRVFPKETAAADPALQAADQGQPLPAGPEPSLAGLGSEIRRGPPPLAVLEGGPDAPGEPTEAAGG